MDKTTETQAVFTIASMGMCVIEYIISVYMRVSGKNTRQVKHLYNE